jgi:hypothetical protein
VLSIYTWSDWKVMQPILKYLLMVAVQRNLIGLINTRYCYDYTRALAVMPCCNLLIPFVFRQTKCKDVIFKSAASVYCQTLYGISFLFNFPERVRDTFHNSPVPNKLTCYLVNCFPDTGSMHDRKCFGEPLVLSDDVLDDVHQTLLCFAWKSLRKLSLWSGLSYGGVCKAIKIL